MNKYLVVVLLIALSSSFISPGKGKVLVIQQCSTKNNLVSGDTIYLQYCYGTVMINDSIKKFCGADTAMISTICITNPGYIIHDMYFGRFTSLEHLILIGNDESYLDSIHYNFFDNPHLKRITFSSVYMTNGPEGKKGGKAVKSFIHGQRKDIKVRIKPMGAFNEIDGFE